MNDVEKLLRIAEYADGETFGRFVWACTKHLSMSYEEAVEWVHRLKDAMLVFEDNLHDRWTAPEYRNYKNNRIHYMWGAEGLIHPRSLT